MHRIHGRSWALVVVLLAASAGACGGGRHAAGGTPGPGTSPPTRPEVAATAGPATTTSSVPVMGPATVVTRGNPNRRMIALTFDAGADGGFAAQILDTLDWAGVKATFGVTGQWAEQHPDLVVRMAREGHQILNHTYDHRSFTGVSARPAVAATAERRDELTRADTVIRGLTGQTTAPWFRPPYGDYDASVNADVGAVGYRYSVLWSVDSLGWQGVSSSAIVARCLKAAAPGSIMLFHVGAASQDSAALPTLISNLTDTGYSFGTVAQVLAP